VLLLGVALLTVLGVRAWEAERGRPLSVWHTFAPEELSAAQLDVADWDAYLEAENAAFAAVQREVTEELEPDERVPINRYFDGAPMHPGRFEPDWNRSFVLEPQAAPVGAAVLLHGLTDSPYSMRQIARRYRAHGFVSLAIRLPAHGTVPGALAEIDWQDWTAATRLAVREALRRSGPSAPLHLIGYSNGGALALQYALDALDDPELARPTAVVLISPMIGVTRFARFAGLAGLPAIFPRFARAAWLSVMPEFNPFKYNSFPVNAARQTHLLTDVLRRQIERQTRSGSWSQLAPILTFQSVVDSTVLTRSLVSLLYAGLPANGSELVLYDLNRSADFGPLLRPAADAKLSEILPSQPRPYRSVVVTNASSESREVVERVVEAGETAEHTRALGLSFPVGVFSLSHIALPFPIDDPLYGLTPDPSEDFGIQLGATALRGERGVLETSLDSLMRMTSNPFFVYQLARIEERLEAPDRAPTAAPGVSSAEGDPRVPAL
jgi:alpha-beta hydrolase superfamily lysophospholipase